MEKGTIIQRNTNSNGVRPEEYEIMKKVGKRKEKKGGARARRTSVAWGVGKNGIKKGADSLKDRPKKYKEKHQSMA